MWTNENRAVAARHSVVRGAGPAGWGAGDDLEQWRAGAGAGLEDMLARIGGRFTRVEPRRC